MPEDVPSTTAQDGADIQPCPTILPESSPRDYSVALFTMDGSLILCFCFCLHGLGSLVLLELLQGLEIEHSFFILFLVKSPKTSGTGARPAIVSRGPEFCERIGSMTKRQRIGDGRDDSWHLLYRACRDLVYRIHE